MNKILLIITIILLSLSILTLAQDQILQQKSLNISSFTKAVCENNFCQDYFFECKDKIIKSISPITGASIQFDKNWKDPRTNEQINKAC